MELRIFRLAAYFPGYDPEILEKSGVRLLLGDAVVGIPERLNAAQWFEVGRPFRAVRRCVEETPPSPSNFFLAPDPPPVGRSGIRIAQSVSLDSESSLTNPNPRLGGDERCIRKVRRALGGRCAYSRHRTFRRDSHRLSPTSGRIVDHAFTDLPRIAPPRGPPPRFPAAITEGPSIARALVPIDSRRPTKIRLLEPCRARAGNPIFYRSGAFCIFNGMPDWAAIWWNFGFPLAPWR